MSKMLPASYSSPHVKQWADKGRGGFLFFCLRIGDAIPNGGVKAATHRENSVLGEMSAEVLSWHLIQALLVG